MREFQSLGDWHDFWSTILLSAPDRFRSLFGVLLPDQEQALREAFVKLRSGFPFAEKKLKDERLSKIAQELIEMSFEAYCQGDGKTGAHTLQECEGLIWPGGRVRPKYAVEAERRAFGENVIYAGVVISPYPYEGDSTDLGPDQAVLLKLAEEYCHAYQRELRDFRFFSWVMDNEGVVWRTSKDPKEDSHPILQPVQKSWGHKRLKELGQSGQIRACVLMEIVGPQGTLGIVTYDLEERGRPRVSARQSFSRTDFSDREFRYERTRYHLEDPQFFPGLY